MKKRIIVSSILAVVLLSTAWLHAGDEPAEKEVVPIKGPIKVYILFGQSNMFGFGKVKGAETLGTLEYMIKEKGKYPNLVDKDGNWVVRKDVRYVHVMQSGKKFKTLRNEWMTVGGD